MKINIRLAAVLAAFAVLLAACRTAGDLQADGSGSDSTAPFVGSDRDGIEDATVSYDSEDTDPTWDDAFAVKIALSDSGIEINGTGATADGTAVTITQAGTYVLSGTLSDGQVLVEATKDDKVRLVLNGVDISSSASAAIYCSKADKLIITLAEGTRNTVTDAAQYTYADEESEEPDAAIFCKDDLSINGSGSLTVNGNFNNGIGSKDDLLIADGSYHITAANHGIRSRDSLTILGGDFTIQAGNDGIQSNNDDEGKGWILLEGGSYSITADHDGIQAESTLTINGGDFSILTGGGNEAAAIDPDGSYKGLKAESDITITAGTFVIDSADDAIHSNGDILIQNGSFQLSSGDDGVHADGDLTVQDGDIRIVTCYEGLEAMTMTIAGGTIDIFASDDGINIAGGGDSGEGGRFGRDSFNDGVDRWLLISGGVIRVETTSGDCIDINGSGEMTGGEVYLNGPVRGPDVAFDFDRTFSISGGILIAAGNSSMAQAPGSDSTQPSLMVYYSAGQAAGSAASLADKDGNTIISFSPAKEYENIVFSSPDLVQGETYTLQSDGETVVEITLSDITTYISDTGEAASGFGMGGRPGGMGGGMGGRPGGDGSFQPPSDGEMPQRPGGGEGGGPGEWPQGGRGDREPPEEPQ